MSKPKTIQPKYLVLYILTGHPLVRWEETKKIFVTAIFDNCSLAHHAIEDFRTSTYPSKAEKIKASSIRKKDSKRYVAKKKRDSSYTQGLFTSEFVDAWKKVMGARSWSIPHYERWATIGVVGPSSTSPWPKELFLAVSLETLHD